MQAQEIHAAIRTVKREIARWPDPVVGVVARQSGRDPFLVLISCLLSLRTKDKTTAEASERLFALASTPATMQALTTPVIERAIYPVGFYRTKAKQIQQICAQLRERYQGRVPDKIDELLTLPGVGRKTANLVVTVGYEKTGICVDIHVHRTTPLPAGLAIVQPVQDCGVLRSRRRDEKPLSVERRYASSHQPFSEI